MGNKKIIIAALSALALLFMIGFAIFLGFGFCHKGEVAYCKDGVGSYKDNQLGSNTNTKGTRAFNHCTKIVLETEKSMGKKLTKREAKGCYKPYWLTGGRSARSLNTNMVNKKQLTYGTQYKCWANVSSAKE